MVEKLVKRKEGEVAAIQGKQPVTRTAGGDQIVSDSMLFAELGNKLKVVRRGDIDR